MRFDLDELESYPLRGKVSWVDALRREKTKGCGGYMDYDLTNQDRNRFMNIRSKNAKAKHRKKFNR